MIIKNLINLRFLWTALSLIFILKFTISFNTGLFEDEAIYWNWSESLDPSYSLTTLFAIKFFTFLFGSSQEIIIRLPALINNFILLFLIFKIGNLLKVDQLKILLTSLLFFSIPFVTIYTTFISPDSFLLLFSVASIYFLLRVIRFNNYSDWIMSGLCIGFLILSKYMGIILFFSILIYLILYRKNFGNLFGLKIFSFVSTTLITVSPLIIWNILNDPIWFNHYMFTEADRSTSGYSENLLTFLLSQVAIALPFAFILLALIFRNSIIKRQKTNEEFLLIFSSTTMILVFILVSLSGKIKGNWSFIMYIPILISALFLVYNKITKLLFALCLIANLLLLLLLNMSPTQIKYVAYNSFVDNINHSFHYYWPDYKSNANNDKSWTERIIKMKSWQATILAVENEIKVSNLKYDFIASDDFNLSPLLEYYFKDNKEVYVIGDLRFKYINSAETNNNLTGKDALIISYRGSRHEFLKNKFETVTYIDSIKNFAGNEINQDFQLLLCKNFKRQIVSQAK